MHTFVITSEHFPRARQACLYLIGLHLAKLHKTLTDSQMRTALTDLTELPHKMEKILEGAKFSQQAAAIDGPYAEQARHNALVMKNEADRMR